MAITDQKGKPVLSVRHLSVYFPQKTRLFSTGEAKTQVLFNIDLDLYSKQIVALVGESGSGKSTIGNAIVGLVEDFSGELSFRGEHYNPMDMLHLRRHIQIIFQDPLSSLNPRITVGQALEEVLSFHFSNRQERKNIYSLLNQVELPNQVASKYPYELSGGQRQRACIARALAVNPHVLICDEIVSSLDVSIQAKILNLISHLLKTRDLAILFTTHDLNVVRAFADVVLVLSKGIVVERGEVKTVYENPVHPYTQTLLDAIPGKSIRN